MSHKSSTTSLFCFVLFFGPCVENWSIPTINEHIREGVADIKILVDGLKIDGMSKFETQKVDADLQVTQSVVFVGQSVCHANLWRSTRRTY